MSEIKIDEIINYLPDLSEKIPETDDKFLFFFDPVILEDKFLFGLSLKTGVQIFSIIKCIPRYISSLFFLAVPHFYNCIYNSLCCCFLCFSIYYEK